MKTIFNIFFKFFMFIVIGISVTATSVISAPSFQEVDLSTDGRWDVTYEGRSYDPLKNQTTFTYTVSVNDDPALSHFTVGFPLCDDLSVVTFSPEGASVGLDPTTGVYGIKWDIGLDPGQTRTYSFTLLGNIGEELVDVAVKAGTYAALGKLMGPSCDTVVQEDKFDISGTLFLDPNKNGVQETGEIGLSNITVALYDADNKLIATTLTDSSGNYIFSGQPVGEYTVSVPASTDNNDFNENLDEYFIATGPEVLNISLVNADSEGNNIGYVPDTGAVLNDFDTDDPDSDGFVFTGTGKTIGYWKHQLAVAIKGKGRAHVDAGTLTSYITRIEELYLPDPFVLYGSYENAFDILKSTSSDAVDLLKKQLLGTEFNEMAGQGLTEDYAYLQSVLIAWGEFIVANETTYSREEILIAKDIFDAINNSGN